MAADGMRGREGAGKRADEGGERADVGRREETEARGGVGSESEPEMGLETEMRVWDRSRPASHGERRRKDEGRAREHEWSRPGAERRSCNRS